MSYKSYISIYEKNKFFFDSINQINNFLRELNNQISDNEYKIISNNKIESLPVSDVRNTINSVYEFFKEIDEDFADEFITYYNNKKIFFDSKFKKNCCYYNNAIKNDDKITYPMPTIQIKYSNTILDAVCLVHEFMHVMTEYISLLPKISGDLKEIYEETISISFENQFIDFLIRKNKSEYGILNSVVINRFYESIYKDFTVYKDLAIYLSRKLKNENFDNNETYEKYICDKTSGYIFSHGFATLLCSSLNENALMKMYSNIKFKKNPREFISINFDVNNSVIFLRKRMYIIDDSKKIS